MSFLVGRAHRHVRKRRVDVSQVQSPVQRPQFVPATDRSRPSEETGPSCRGSNQTICVRGQENPR